MSRYKHEHGSNTSSALFTGFDDKTLADPNERKKLFGVGYRELIIIRRRLNSIKNNFLE